MTGSRGVALILVLVFMSFLAALGLGLTLMVFIEYLAAGNMRHSVDMLHAADAGLELAARDLAHLPDWSDALNGSVQSRFTDGVPGGVRQVPGGSTVELSVLTNRLNCGRDSGCTSAQMDASTRERPWGVNNARWRLFAYGPFGAMAEFARPAPCYVAVWVADDGRERDDDPAIDGAGDAAHGAGIVRIRAEAYGPAGSRRAVEAEVVRQCIPDPVSVCRAGIRVQSWQEVRQGVP
jgi:hypothetical protein